MKVCTKVIMSKILTYCPIDIGLLEEERVQMRDEILSVSDDYWFYDEFRGCYMLPIFNGGGKMGQLSDHKWDFDFTEAGKQCNNVMTVSANKIFNWMSPLSRLTILKTLPGVALNPHLDCSTYEIGTAQYKFRIVLAGKVDNLYFLNADDIKIFVPNMYKEYILDGGHVHGLDAHKDIKLTLCGGAPWGRDIRLPNETVYNKHLIVDRPTNLKKEWYRK